MEPYRRHPSWIEDAGVADDDDGDDSHLVAAAVVVVGQLLQPRPVL